MHMTDKESRFAFFLGAGCSVSSEIPSSSTLVKNWLPKLKKLKTGNEEGVIEWTKKRFKVEEKDYSLLYGKIIKELFFTAKGRQNEIERLTEGKDPSFGYAVLSQLCSDNVFGSHFNVLMTTNFDDLIADALYLYSNTKPLVILHESLASFATLSRTRPLVIKLHGDAKLEPKNIELETAELEKPFKTAIKKLLGETGLVFLGYGGNDQSIVKILSELDSHSLPWGIYWVSSKTPSKELTTWLDSRDAVWVKHRDFDEFMLLLLNEFGLEHPKLVRFEKMINDYYEKFKKLQDKIEKLPESDEKTTLEKAYGKAVKKANPDFQIVHKANSEAKKDLKKAEKTYLAGIKENPKSVYLLHSYASFLRNDMKFAKSEAQFKKALEIEPDDLVTLMGYVLLLDFDLKLYDKAEKIFKKVLEDHPKYFTAHAYYAGFLTRIRKNYNKAEKHFKIALDIRSSLDVQIDYAEFQLITGRHNEAIERLEIITTASTSENLIELAGANVLLYAFSKTKNKQRAALVKLKNMIESNQVLGKWIFLGSLENIPKEDKRRELILALQKRFYTGNPISFDKFSEWTKLK